MQTNFSGWQMPDFNAGFSAKGLNQAYQAQPLAASVGNPTAAPQSMWSMDSIFGNQNQMGWGNTALAGVNALAQGWMGMEQLNLAKDNFKFQKEAFNTNLANQTKLTNQQLLDRQRARYAANPNAYSAVNEQWKGENLL